MSCAVSDEISIYLKKFKQNIKISGSHLNYKEMQIYRVKTMDRHKRGEAVSAKTPTTHIVSLKATRRGGQSASRYLRLNDKKKLSYLTSIACSMYRFFTRSNDIIIGPDPIKESLYQLALVKGYFSINQDKLFSTADCSPLPTVHHCRLFTTADISIHTTLEAAIQ